MPICFSICKSIGHAPRLMVLLMVGDERKFVFRESVFARKAQTSHERMGFEVNFSEFQLGENEGYAGGRVWLVNGFGGHMEDVAAVFQQVFQYHVLCEAFVGIARLVQMDIGIIITHGREQQLYGFFEHCLTLPSESNREAPAVGQGLVD